MRIKTTREEAKKMIEEQMKGKEVIEVFLEGSEEGGYLAHSLTLKSAEVYRKPCDAVLLTLITTFFIEHVLKLPPAEVVSDNKSGRQIMEFNKEDFETQFTFSITLDQKVSQVGCIVYTNLPEDKYVALREDVWAILAKGIKLDFKGIVR